MKQTAARAFAWAWQIVLLVAMIAAAWIAAGALCHVLYHYFMLGWRLAG